MTWGQDVTETCEDRDYRCCDLTPPVPPAGEMTDAEYHEWYDRHVKIYGGEADGT